MDELTYLVESGSDRTGALDFHALATEYEERATLGATLDELLQSAERVEAGVPLTPEHDRALHHGSSLGGAWPKAFVTDGATNYVATFPAAGDVRNVVKAEFVAMRLAVEAGLDVARSGWPGPEARTCRWSSASIGCRWTTTGRVEPWCLR